MSWSTGAGGNNGGALPTAISVAATFGSAIAINDVLIAYAQRTYTTQNAASDTCADSLGNVYTLGGSGHSALDLECNNWFYSIATVAGTPTVTVTYPETQPNRGICIQSYRSTLGRPMINQTATWTSRQDLLGGPPDNLLVGPIVPSVSGCKVVVGFMNCNTAGDFTAGTGFTLDQDTGQVNISYTALESLTQAVAASITGVGNDSGAAAHYLGFMASFRESQGLPSDTPFVIRGGAASW